MSRTSKMLERLVIDAINGIAGAESAAAYSDRRYWQLVTLAQDTHKAIREARGHIASIERALRDFDTTWKMLV